MSCTASIRARAARRRAMIDAAGLAWTVEQHPLEAVLGNADGGEPSRVPGAARRGERPQRHARRARRRGRGVRAAPEPRRVRVLRRDHRLGRGALARRGRDARRRARPRADAARPRRSGSADAEGEDVLPLLCFRNGHDGGLAVTISVAPFRLACLNGMLLPLDGRAADVEGAPHREPGRAARRRAPHARDRLALLRRVGAGRRAADPRADERGRVRALPLAARAAARAAARPRRTAGAPCATSSACARRSRTAYRATPDLANITRHALGRAASRHGVRRSRRSPPARPPAAPTRRRASSARPSRPRSRTARSRF